MTTDSDQVVPGADEPLVRVRNVEKSFGDNHVLKGVDLDIYDSTVTVLLGPSGSGKTTILRALNALDPPDSGTVSVNNVEVDFGADPPKEQVAKLTAQSGFVFQSHNLFPHKTVLENVTIGPIKGQRHSAENSRADALRILKNVGLADKADSYPWQLSGGQQQRVGIARALALHPKVILLDEPTSALDPEIVGEVLELIRAVADSGCTLVIVTHEIQFAREVADQVVFLYDGVILEKGTPEDVLSNPREDRTIQFLSRIR